jgi:hypothetical protein
VQIKEITWDFIISHNDIEMELARVLVEIPNITWDIVINNIDKDWDFFGFLIYMSLTTRIIHENI